MTERMRRPILWAGNAPGGNYTEAIQALLRRVTAPGLYHVEVQHDDDCPLLRGTGPCSCSPDVVLYGDEAP